MQCCGHSASGTDLFQLSLVLISSITSPVAFLSFFLGLSCTNLLILKEGKGGGLVFLVVNRAKKVQKNYVFYRLITATSKLFKMFVMLNLSLYLQAEQETDEVYAQITLIPEQEVRV